MGPLDRAAALQEITSTQKAKTVVAAWKAIYFADRRAAAYLNCAFHPTVSPVTTAFIRTRSEARQMSEQHKASIPMWFWLLAIVALLWNLMGCFMFLIEVFAQDEMMESMTAEQQAWARSTPSWIYFVFAIAVSTGLAGSICLLKRRSLSVLLFTVSVVAVLIQMVYTMLLAGGLQVMGPSGAVMPAVVVILSIAWLSFARLSQGKGWLAP